MQAERELQNRKRELPPFAEEREELSGDSAPGDRVLH